jgi:hypothetical protein
VPDVMNLPICEELKPSKDTALVNENTQIKESKLSLVCFESVQLVFNDSHSFMVFPLLATKTTPAFLSQLVPWSPKKKGWLGVLYQFTGVVGSFFLVWCLTDTNTTIMELLPNANGM